jgi:hypothetical protein
MTRCDAIISFLRSLFLISRALSLNFLPTYYTYAIFVPAKEIRSGYVKELEKRNTEQNAMSSSNIS